VVLAVFGPGEFFGELSIFDGEMRSATVIAVEETEVLALGRFDIVRVVSHNPQIGLSLLKSLSARLRATDARLVDAMPPTPEH
jgi:CRP-like cAMP-binding protein